MSLLSAIVQLYTTTCSSVDVFELITFCRSRNALLNPHVQRDLINHCTEREGAITSERDQLHILEEYDWLVLELVGRNSLRSPMQHQKLDFVNPGRSVIRLLLLLWRHYYSRVLIHLIFRSKTSESDITQTSALKLTASLRAGGELSRFVC